ncbi:MAG: hypothetical protein WCR40_02925 [Candidatus Paceibacterota bacterium]
MQTSAIVSVQSKIAAEMLLGKIRLPNRGGEPSYLPRLRECCKRVEKTVGREAVGECIPEVRAMMHAIADGMFDAVTGVKLDKTIQGIKALNVTQRIAVEMILSQATGKSSDKRWDDTLYHIRKIVDQIVTTSISGLTVEEVRDGYDPFIHTVVDHLCDNWKTLID